MILREPIFIVGVNKSGTSLLYLAMSRHSSLSAIRSFRPPRDLSSKPDRAARAMLYMENYGIGEGQRIPGLPDKLAPKQDPGHFATRDTVAAYRLTEADVEPGDADAVARAYASAMIRPSARLCEKSPPNFIRTRFLQALFPDATFVALVRDPFATVAANGKKRTKWGDVAVQAEHWAEAHRLFLEDRPWLRRCLTIRYQDLVHEFDGALAEICAFCGLEFETSMSGAIPVDGGVDARMVQLLSEHEAGEIAARCGPLAESLGFR